MVLLRLMSWPYFRKHVLRTLLTASGRAPGDGWRVLGDPTEGALLVAAAKAQGVGHELPTEWFTEDVHP